MMKFLKNPQNIKIYFIIISLFFSLIFSFKFINLSFINFELNGLLNYPSNTSIDDIYITHDLPMIFSWARRAIENFSIFELGSNLSGIDDKYHHFSSRGLGLFLFGCFLFIFDSPINAITFSYIVFGLINFYLILNYFKNLGFITSVFLSCCSVLFASKVFGGVLNPWHYFEYFIREVDNLKNTDNFLAFYTALYRAPNILINNVFIFLSFYAIKNFDGQLFNLKSLSVFVLIILSTIIDPLIFLVSGLFFFFKISIQFIKKDMSKKNFIILISFLFLISTSLIFHYQNSVIAFGDNERHGTGLDGFWTGNPIFSLEMLIFPLILYFFLEKKEHKSEALFLLSVLIIYCLLFIINEVVASRITNRNFEIIIACISYSFIFDFFKNFNKKKLVISSILLLLHLPYVYLLAGKILFIKYLFVFLIATLLVIACYYFMKIKNNYKIMNVLHYFFIILFFVSLFKHNANLNSEVKSYEIEQKKFFNWISKQENKKSLISLNLGLLMNSELQTNQNVYISNITNVPSKIKRKDLQKRLNHIFFLYGFTETNLKEYLKDYITLWEINKNNYNDHQLNLALLNKIIFYENFQNNYVKTEPINQLTDSYTQYLKEEEYMHSNNSQICVITKYDEIFIQKNSYFEKVKNTKPIYNSNFLKAYNCDKTNKI